MSDSLPTYLQDHLAGANSAIEMLESWRDDDAGPLRTFAAQLLPDVVADRDTLQDILARCGEGRHLVKDAAAWISEKVSRLKLQSGELGTLEGLETLSLGILGKLALWRALATIAANEPRLSGLDLERLASRAQSQHHTVEQRRLEAARQALLSDAAG